jgi:hypothetical protein
MTTQIKPNIHLSSSDAYYILKKIGDFGNMHHHFLVEKLKEVAEA